MKKHPVDGARARARALRQDMTEAERRVWQTELASKARLIVEIDAGHHDLSSPQEAERSRFL